MIIILNVKAVVDDFNQENALVGAFSVITNLRIELFEALMDTIDTARLRGAGTGLEKTLAFVCQR